MEKPLVAITGATSGIGLKTALRFSEAGYPLLLMGRHLEKLKSFALPNVMIKHVDVTNIDMIKSAITEAESQYGPMDCLLNVAGMMLLGDIGTQNPQEWHLMLEVNILGVLNGMQAVLPNMKKRQQGTIINVSSIAGIKPFAHHAAYVGTKFAVHGLTDNVREEVASDNIRVMIVAPGAVETPLLSHTSSDQIKVKYEAWKKSIGGVLGAEDVARVMLYAYEQPQNVCLREIVLSSTKQSA